jgi:LacI family transcriptional regulator, repressor for deo operon, udp, cdd, tsx, nupC, and nupG
MVGSVKPRLRHVAELAGVSQATVSRVLNGRAGVAEATRREVLSALQQLGYEPVGVARARRTGLVGLIVPELENPVFPRFSQAIESRLAGEGLTTVLCTSTPSGMREGDYVDVLLDHAVTGIIIVSGEHADTHLDHSRYHDLAARRIPTVLVNGTLSDSPVPTVTVDHAAATGTAVAHLVALGHQRIGLAVGPRRYVPSIGLVEGYLAGLRAAGLPADESLVSETVYGIEGGHVAGLRLLEFGVTGVVCASDRMALGVIRAARENDLRVPEDISVVGFDDAGPNAYMEPPLTSVQQPFERMSDAIVRLLTESIADPTRPPTALRFRPELVVRGSTGVAADLIAARAQLADTPDEGSVDPAAEVHQPIA